MFFARTSCRLLTATAIAWLGVLLASQAAVAGCGDWLDDSGGQMATHSASDVTNPNLPPTPRPPCNGPSCRGNQHLPLAPPPAPQDLTQRDYAALNGLADLDGARAPRVWTGEQDAVALAGYPLGVEHRPRV